MPFGLKFLSGRQRATKKRLGGNPDRFISHSLASWTDVPMEDIPQVPGMTQEDELKYFYWCCATQHRPGHRVVELGPYVGRSTLALTAGLRRSPDVDGKLFSLDCFRWNTWALENTLANTLRGLSESQRARLSDRDLQPGENDSFFPLFEIYTESYKDSIEVVNDQIETYRWGGESIDVLMIDAAKCWDSLDQIIRQYFPCLIDGAVVIHQDYKHYFTYWLHPVTERMLEKGVLTLAENIQATPTQGFRFHKLPDFDVEDYLRSAFTSAEIERLMARSVRRFRSEHERLALAGARCQSFKDQGKPAQAKAAFVQAIREGGFVDNYALSDLLMIAQDWTRPLTLHILGIATKPTRPAADIPRVVAASTHSIAISAPAEGRSFVLDIPAFEATGATEVALNFHADGRSQEALRIRIQATEADCLAPFYDEEFPMPPRSYQPVVIPLNGSPKVSLRWITSGEGRPAPIREITCIAPMLLGEW